MGKERVVPVFLRYSNVHLVRDGTMMLVDAGYPGNAERILDAIKEEGRPREVSLIVITHAHLDHIGSLPGLRKSLAAKIAIHRDEAVALRTGKGIRSTKTPILGKLMGSRGVKDWEPMEPDIVVDREIDLKNFGIDGTIIPTPGHTSGSLSILLGSGEALVGDLVVGGMIKHSKPSYSLFMEDKVRVTESVIDLLGRGAKTFYGSHGGPFSADEVRKKFVP